MNTPCEIACPICQTHSWSSWIDRTPDYVTGQTFSVLQCTNCSIRVTHPRPENLDPFYPPRYRAYKSVITSVLRWMYTKRVQGWLSGCPPKGRALEIGCGDGFMLEVFQKFGWKTVGIERNAHVAAATEKRLSCRVYSTGFEGIPENELFDIVLLFQVLEHLADPLALLKECRRRLAPGGKLIIGVPNSHSWQASLFRGSWFHLDPPRHLFHFSSDSLTRLLHQAGFSVQHISFVSFEHDPYGWIQSLENLFTDNPNQLTSFLMGMKPLATKTILQIGVAALLCPCAVLLSILSWACKRGAIMHVHATTSNAG